jgi:hypothetical protein
MIVRAYREAFLNAIAPTRVSHQWDCAAHCDRLLAMRRVQSAIVIVVLLAIPVALPARTGPCAEFECGHMCALILHSVRAADHQHCVCGMAMGESQCSQHSSQKIPDYGLNAPIAPTMPSVRAAIVPPVPTRRAAPARTRFADSDFVSEFFKPPRA